MIPASFGPEDERVHLMYCPMVKNAWLQRSEEIANPFDPQMHSCGALQRTVTTDAKGGER
ncbi:DUF3347 domain-containing protein [Leptolyngbya sp. 15MV]|nr:DUF3347 domain-containing protein [Leptolyngbya sp. 15MV]